MSQNSSISRRDLLKLSAGGAVGACWPNWMAAQAEDPASLSHRDRSLIILWMTGGASQIDTFDLKPDHENGGPFRPISTSAEGVQICEHLPRMSRLMHHCVPIRSMSTPETDHIQATHHVRTGVERGSMNREMKFSSLRAQSDWRLKNTDGDLPGYVALSPYRRFNTVGYGTGILNFAGAKVIVDDAQRSGLNPHIDEFRINSTVPRVRSELSRVLRLDSEPASLRDAYGRNRFGQACLAARRLVEHGVPVVEVSLNDSGSSNAFAWDTHSDNSTATRNLMRVLDPAWSTLLLDLQDRGLLDSTLVVWMSEFGRTPQINAQNGRDHFSAAWSTVLCGGGIQGGQAIGQTSVDGMTIENQPVSAADLLATVHQAVTGRSEAMIAFEPQISLNLHCGKSIPGIL